MIRSHSFYWKSRIKSSHTLLLKLILKLDVILFRINLLQASGVIILKCRNHWLSKGIDHKVLSWKRLPIARASISTTIKNHRTYQHQKIDTQETKFFWWMKSKVQLQEQQLSSVKIYWGKVLQTCHKKLKIAI